MEFEYIQVKLSRDCEICRNLNRLGSDGWELVNSVVVGTDTVFYFKREIKEFESLNYFNCKVCGKKCCSQREVEVCDKCRVLLSRCLILDDSPWRFDLADGSKLEYSGNDKRVLDKLKSLVQSVKDLHV